MSPRSADDGKALVLPPSVRWAGWIGMAEGIAGLAFAVYLVIGAVRGDEDTTAQFAGAGAESIGYGWGTAAWFGFFGGVIAVAGWCLSTGRRWGRGPVAMLQLFLVLISVYMFSSGRPELGAPTAALGVVGLALMFNPSAVEWAARRYGR
ncbi:hypothetical protein [Corynebacterium glyciniphilum]|nr:hypothetical protein [Corynebacterium glyciniphilum]